MHPPVHVRLTLLTLLTGCLMLLPNSSAQPAAPDASPVPLQHAHAHNDYLHPRPLLDALDHGFCSVEADVFLIEDQLLIAHDLPEIRPERTLENLYLRPLLERVRERGGHVHSADTRFYLLIDIKSDALPTYQAIDQLLQQYAEMLTRFDSERTLTNAVTVTISGNRPRDFIQQQSPRFAAYDGRLADLDTDASHQFIPLVSDNWRSHFQWRGEGPLPETERMKLRELVRRAHDQGRAIRFWAHPDEPQAWEVLREAGVDFINTDQLTALRDFLLHP